MSCAASRALLLLLLLAVVAAPCVAHRRRHRHQHAEAAAAPALLRAARSTTEQPPCPPRSLRHATEAARTLVSNLIDDHIRDAYCMMTAEFQSHITYDHYMAWADVTFFQVRHKASFKVKDGQIQGSQGRFTIRVHSAPPMVLVVQAYEQFDPESSESLGWYISTVTVASDALGEDGDDEMQGWALALIIAAAVILVLGGFLMWSLRHVRRRKAAAPLPPSMPGIVEEPESPGSFPDVLLATPRRFHSRSRLQRLAPRTPEHPSGSQSWVWWDSVHETSPARSEGALDSALDMSLSSVHSDFDESDRPPTVDISTPRGKPSAIPVTPK
eukprot:m.194763 g.194763  ORF g.194763 m.194763 type:complete len:328 (-) comp10623_c0_seq1:92-1075(-)